RAQIAWVIGIIVVIGVVVYWRNRTPSPQDLANKVFNSPMVKEMMEKAEAQAARMKTFSNPRRLHSLAEYANLQDASDEGAYLKGKVIVIFRSSAAQGESRPSGRLLFASMNYSLPEELQPMTPEDVGTVVLIQEKREGKCVAEVKIIDRTRPALVGV